jgi:hypothetical protein
MAYNTGHVETGHAGTGYAPTGNARTVKTVLGFPLEGFGFLTSMLLSVATGFFTFFATTCLSIFALLTWNILGKHAVNYADTYLYVGFPLGVAALVVSVAVFGTLWVRGKIRS